MQINFGCGRRVLSGFYNIDAVHNPKALRKPELIHAVKFDKAGAVVNPIPLKPECANYLQAMHVIEHVYKWEAPALVCEWLRLLKPGGELVLELPNLTHAAKNLLAGCDDQLSMWPLYGDPNHKDPYMCHRWGYTPHTIKKLLSDCGLKAIQISAPQTHGKRTNRDMRIQGLKI